MKPQRQRIQRYFLFAACVQASLGSLALADDWIRPQDEVFLVNTRLLGPAAYQGMDWERLQIHRYTAVSGERCRRWTPVSLDEFYAGDPSRLTLVYVHGNWVAWGEDTSRGLNFYRSLLRHVPDPPPLRLVIFSWPTDRTRGMLRDFRMKADRADPAGLHLAWILSRMRPGTPLAIAGYSFGARVITGALHVMAGGSLCGAALPEPARVGPVRVLLIAAAVHEHWLHAGGRHGMALQPAEQLILITNHCDPAMRFYHAIEARSHPLALGQYGITRPWTIPGAGRRVTQFDACYAVGKRHGEVYYLNAGSALRAAGSELLLFSQPSPPPP